MKKFASLTLLLAAGMPALVSTARAQLVDFDTISEYQSGDNTIGFTYNTPMTQTFTDVQEITNMTYQFIATGASTTATSITAYFVQWNPSTNQPASTTPVFSETFSVPATSTGDNLENSPAWTTYEYADDSGTYIGYNVSLDVDSLLNPSDTYAMILVDNTTTGSDIGLMDVSNSYPNTPYANSAGPFATDISGTPTELGEAYKDNTNRSAGTLSAMDSISEYDEGGSYGFSQLDVVPVGNNLVPLPEPRDAAIAITALFVAALVGRQLYLRRREQPIAALAA